MGPHINEIISLALGFLPFLFFLLLIIYKVFSKHDLSSAIIEAFLTLIVVSYILAELLSLIGALDFPSTLVCWCVLIAVIGCKVYSATTTFDITTSSRSNIPLLIIALFAFVTLIIVCTAAPNNWDSQTYHLPRIEHWIQNRSLEHYPTSIGRQLAYGPVAEILLMHTRLMSGNDYYYLLPQWISMLVCTAAAFRVCRQLGGSETQGWLASVFVITLPIGILESTSTQNDYITAAALIGFVSLGLQLLELETPRMPLILMTALAGSISGLVKPTAYLLGAGYSLLFAWALARKLRTTRFLASAFAASFVFVMISAPYAIRNINTWGTIQSDQAMSTSNASFGLDQTVSVFILDIASNLSTGFSEIDQKILSLTMKSVDAFNYETLKSDITFWSTKFTLPEHSERYHEDRAPNPIHTLLILTALIYFVFGERNSHTSIRGKYWLAWCAGVITFVIFLRWQPWITRLQLPGFVLAAPVVASAWPKSLRSTKTIAPVFLLLLASGWNYLWYNTSRSLLSSSTAQSYLTRSKLLRLFANNPSLALPYSKAIDQLIGMNASSIGLALGGDDWEYPIWSLLKQRTTDHPVRIEHLIDESCRCRWPLGPFSAQALVWTLKDPPSQVSFHGQTFCNPSFYGPVVVYLSSKSCSPSFDSLVDIPLNYWRNSTLLSGWSYREGWGMWTKAAHAQIETFAPPGPSVLSITGRGFVRPSNKDGQIVKIFANDRFIGEMVFHADETSTFTFLVPPLATDKHTTSTLSFRISDPTRPSELFASSSDHRKLGFGLIRLSLHFPAKTPNLKPSYPNGSFNQ